MVPATSLQQVFGRWSRSAGRWLQGWWRLIFIGAQVVALALSPSSYSRDGRQSAARHLYEGAVTTLPWFAVLSTLISLIMIRIVVVTARSYGLSQYALEMVVRVLVIELIPLTAALFVALRYTIPAASDLHDMRETGQLDRMRAQGLDPLQRELLPRVLGGVFASLLLASVSGVASMLLAYLTVYGFTPWGFDAYTRTFGQVFNPSVTLIFSFKALFFSLAVSWIPMAAAVDGHAGARSRTHLALHGLIRMFTVILMIEIVSLMGNYY